MSLFFGKFCFRPVCALVLVIGLISGCTSTTVRKPASNDACIKNGECDSVWSGKKYLHANTLAVDLTAATSDLQVKIWNGSDVAHCSVFTAPMGDLGGNFSTLHEDWNLKITQAKNDCRLMLMNNLSAIHEYMEKHPDNPGAELKSWLIESDQSDPNCHNSSVGGIEVIEH
jgi:hypothetical protein